MYYKARWYDPTSGRFGQADSIIPESSQGVQAWDRYAYANNNSIKSTDPTGHCIGPLLPFCIAVGAFIVDHAAIISAVAITGAITSFVGSSNPDPELINDPVASQERFENSLYQAGMWLSAGLMSLEYGNSVPLQKPIPTITGDTFPEYPPGSFDITDWSSYPTEGNVPIPDGPFRLLSGEEYDIARTAANLTNRAIHIINPEYDDLVIHEIKPVKFGGSPTDLNNKIAIPPNIHPLYTNWWNFLQRMLEN